MRKLWRGERGSSRLFQPNQEESYAFRLHNFQTAGAPLHQIGPFTGQRATWANNTLSAGLVGVVKFSANPRSFNCGSGKGAPNNVLLNTNKDYAVVVVTNGKATFVD